MGWYPGKNVIKAVQEMRADKLDYKTENSNNKWEAFNTAYQNGIDPRASMAQMGSNIANAASNAASNIVGFGNAPGKPNPSGAAAAAMSDSPIMLIAIIAIITKLLKMW